MNYPKTLEELRLRKFISFSRWKAFAKEYERRHGLMAMLNLADDLRVSGHTEVYLRRLDSLIIEPTPEVFHMDDIAQDFEAILKRIPDPTDITRSPSSSPDDDYACLSMYISRMEEIRTAMEKLYAKVSGEEEPSDA